MILSTLPRIDLKKFIPEHEGELIDGDQSIPVITRWIIYYELSCSMLYSFKSVYNLYY